MNAEEGGGCLHKETSSTPYYLRQNQAHPLKIPAFRLQDAPL